MEQNNRPVSPFKSAGVWLILALISAGSFLLTNMLMTRGRPAAPPQDGASASCAAVVIMILSILILLAGVAGYLIILATSGFTFRFGGSVWHSSMRMRLYVANILVSTALLLGIGGAASAVMYPLLTMRMDIPAQLSLPIPFLIVLIPGQILLTWLNMWKPLICSLIRKRLSAKGISDEDLDRGIYAGLSDPAVSSMKKFGMIEDDIGMLWIEPDAIRYEGDRQAFRITRSAFTGIDRNVDKGSIAAYAGAVSVILQWNDEDGAQKKARIHLENCWTLSALAGLYDDLAGRIQQWSAAPHSEVQASPPEEQASVTSRETKENPPDTEAQKSPPDTEA